MRVADANLFFTRHLNHNMSTTSSNIIGLQGDAEPPADTIRKLIHDAWQTIQTADDTTPDIQIISQGGVNQTNTPVTQGDAADISQQQGGTYCVITDGRRESAGDANDSSYYAQEVILHVYGDWPRPYRVRQIPPHWHAVSLQL